MRPSLFPRIFLAGFAVAAGGAALAHLLRPEWVSDLSAWPLTPGWQYEIAFFDLFIATLCVTSLRSSQGKLRGLLCPTLASLSMLLGANHLLAYLDSQLALHLQWFVLNAVAVVAGFASTLLTRRTQQAEERG
jgi:hypothetical protein